MFLGTILGWVIAGLVVGAFARLLMPGKQNMGIPMTIILGIVGAVFGGFLGSLFFGPNLTMDSTGAYAVGTAWPGWIMAVLGGFLVLWLFVALSGRRDRIV